MIYATLLSGRQILGFAILGLPAALLLWGWFRLILRRSSDPPIALWIPSVVFLVLITMSYGLTLAQILNSRIALYFFNLWHTSDMAVYLLISFLACLFAWKGKGPIRWQVFATGLLLTILYFAVGWSLMD